MEHNNEKTKKRPLILVGPDGRALEMAEDYSNPDRWETVETQDVVMLVARPDATSKEDLMTRIVTYVDTHLTEQVRLQDVADHCGVSVSTVTQLFQKKSDLTFHQYLTRRRMAAAEQLIRSGLPLEEVGRRVGYRDHSSFYRAFKQVFGISPRQFKQT